MKWPWNLNEVIYNVTATHPCPPELTKKKYKSTGIWRLVYKCGSKDCSYQQINVFPIICPRCATCAQKAKPVKQREIKTSDYKPVWSPGANNWIIREATETVVIKTEELKWDCK